MKEGEGKTKLRMKKSKPKGERYRGGNVGKVGGSYGGPGSLDRKIRKDGG